RAEFVADLLHTGPNQGTAGRRTVVRAALTLARGPDAARAAINPGTSIFLKPAWELISRDAVTSGHGIGKSTLVAWVMLAISFDQALTAVKKTLERHDFAVLDEVDVRKAVKDHVGVDFRPYVGVEHSDCFGTPCGTVRTYPPVSNIVIQDQDQGFVEVSAVD